MKVALMSIRFVTGLFLALLAVVPGQAHERSEAAEKLHYELREYARTELTPALDQWKQTIDATLSADDLARLNEMRAQAAAHRAAQKERMEEYRSLSEDERRALREKMREQRASMHSKRREIMVFFEELKELVQRYPALVEQIREEGATKKSDMKTGALALVRKWEAAHVDELAAAGEAGQRRLQQLKARLEGESVYSPEHPPKPFPEVEETREMSKSGDNELEDGNSHHHRRRESRQHRGHRGWSIGAMDGPHALAMVFLWNGRTEELFGGDMRQAEGSHTDDVLLREGLDVDESMIEIYPNPAVDQATISVNMPQYSDVVIYLLDNTGREVGRLFEGQLSAGKHEFTVDADIYNLSSGVYQFRVVGKNGVQSGPLVITR